MRVRGFLGGVRRLGARQKLALAVLGVMAGEAAHAQQVGWTGAGADDFWGTGGNWSTGVAPGATSNVLFGNTDVQALGVVNNVVEASRTISTLTYSNVTSVGFHTTQINAGVTLSVNSGVSATNVLQVGTGTSVNNATQVQANFVGAGTLALSGSNGVVMVRQGVSGATGASGTQVAVLDLSGLATFTTDVNRVLVGAEGTNDAGGANSPAGLLVLANNNVIQTRSTTEGITIGDASGNPSTNASTILLGQSNVINTNRIKVGARKSIGVLGFRPGLVAPTLTVRGVAGGTNRMAALLIGDNGSTGGSSFTATGTMDLRGGTVDILVDQLIAGRGFNAASALPGQAAGNLVWDAGTIDANTVFLGLQSVAQGGAAAGTITVNLGATFNVNTSMEMARRNTTNPALPSGDLRVNGGTVRMFGNVTDTGGVSTIAMTSGLIDMKPAGDPTAGNLGTAASPIDNLVLTGGTLANLGNGFVTSFSGSGTLSGLTGTLTVDSSVDSTFAGAIGGVGGVSKTNTGTLALTGALSYTGPTVVHSGTLALGNATSLSNSASITVRGGATLDASAGGLTLVAGNTLSGAGTIVGAVTANSGAKVLPGGSNTAGTFSVVGNVSLQGASLTYDLADPAIVGSGVNDLITINGSLSAGGVNLVTINALAGTLASGTYRLIDYGGTLTSGGAANFAVAGSAAGSRRTFTFDTSVGGQVNLTVGGGDPIALVWKGDGVNNRWDLNGDLNWNANTEKFFNLDRVEFDDSGSNTPSVQLVGDLAPGSISVNATKDYTFAGAGRLTGGTGLTKDGSGKLTLANAGVNDFSGTITVNTGVIEVGNGGTAGTLGNGPVVNNAVLSFNRSDDLTAVNDISGGGTIEKRGAGVLTLSGNSTFSGPVSVFAGTLRPGSATGLGDTNGGGITVAAGATLDVNSVSLGNKAVQVVGAGVGGGGAIVNNGAVDQTAALSNVTLTGDTTFGGTARWDIRAGSLNGGGFNLTKTGSNRVQLAGLGETSLGDVLISNGILGFETTTTQGSATNTITIAAAGTLAYFNTGGTNVLNKNIVSNGGRLLNDAGGNVQAGNVTLASGSTLAEMTGGSLTLSGPVSGSGGFVKNGTGDLILLGLNSYTGSTVVNANFLRGNVDGLQGVIVINAVGNGTGVVYQNSADGSSRATFTGPGNLLAGTALGTNVVTLATANTYDGFTALNAGGFRVTHPLALGSTLNGTYVDGGTRVGHIDLAGGVTVVNEYFGAIGRASGNNTAHLLNFSGNNTWTGTFATALPTESINATGVGDHYIVESAAGTLTLAGNVVHNIAAPAGTAAAVLQLQGAATGVISGAIGGTAVGSWTVTKLGTGTWTLSNAANTYTGQTSVQEGLLRVSGSIASSSGVVVTTPGAFEAAGTQRVKSLTLNSASAVVSAGVLTVGDNTTAQPLNISVGQGKIDLTSRGMVVDTSPGSEGAALTELRAQVIAGYGASNPGAGDGNWQGTIGITSSAAAADPSGKGVGYALANEALGAAGGTFMGVGVDGSSVLTRYTLLGDATLDGVVDFNDLVKLAQNYNTTVSDTTDSWWFNGDFTYDGKVDFNDLVKLAQNYNTGLPAAGAIPGAGFDEELARAFANVPEPGGGLLVALAAGGLGRRRRRTATTAGTRPSIC